jgi:hypothetical protein
MLDGWKADNIINYFLPLSIDYRDVILTTQLKSIDLSCRREAERDINIGRALRLRAV